MTKYKTWDNLLLQEAKLDGKTIMERLEEMATPNPGSDAAIEHGCTCPVIDNHYGEGVGGGKFWYTENCPVHTIGGRDEA